MTRVWEEESVWFLFFLCLLFAPYVKAGREIPAKVPGTGISRDESSNEKEECTWDLVLAAHLSQRDPKQKALALTQNGLFPRCQNAHFCVCYLLLHDSFKAGMIENSLPWYMIAGVAGYLVGLTHYKRRCLGKYCFFLVWNQYPCWSLCKLTCSDERRGCSLLFSPSFWNIFSFRLFCFYGPLAHILQITLKF